MSVACKAKRGDLVALVHESVTTYADLRREVRQHVTIHEVAGVTRDGAVAKTRPVGCPEVAPIPLQRHHAVVDRKVIPASTIADMAGAVAAIEGLAGPGRWWDRKLPDLEAARDLMRPYMKAKECQQPDPGCSCPPCSRLGKGGTPSSDLARSAS